MKAFLMLLFGVLSLQCSASADVNSSAETKASMEASSGLSYLDAVILGLVEGITEYLPVSSTGHLILTNAALGLDSDAPMARSDGTLILIDDEDGPRPYTLGEAAYAYVIVIQAGAIAAVVMLYWNTLLKMLFGCLGKDPQGRKLAINLIIAFIPAAIIGLLLDDIIESALGDNVHAVIGALVVGAVAMLVVEAWRKKKDARQTSVSAEKELHDMSPKNAVMIGIFQCFAMWPGTSRSMATIIGGYIAGLTPAKAAEFSFLLGLITLTAASGYKLVSDGSKMIEALAIGPVAVGCIVAFISSLLAVKWLVGYLSRHGLALFAWYRIALALIVLLVLG